MSKTVATARASMAQKEFLTALADALFPVFTVILAAAVLVGESYNPFLYFRF